MGRKKIREQIRNKETALKHAENTIKELKTALHSKNREIKGLQNLLNGDSLPTKDLTELLSTKTTKLEESIRENKRIKKELEGKDEEQNAMNLALTQKESLLESMKEAMQIEAQAFKTELQAKENEVHRVLESKTNEITALEASLNAMERDLEQAITNNESIEEQARIKSEELVTLRSVMTEKDSQNERLSAALRNTEQEFEKGIREKDIEISEIRTSLMAAENELNAIKRRGFWKRLKCCFLNH